MSVVVIVFVGVIVIVLMSVVIVVLMSVVIIVLMSVLIVFMRVVVIVLMRVVVIVLVSVLIVLMHVPRSPNGNDLDASRDFHDRTVFRRAFDHREQGFFNAAAIDEDHIGFRQRRQLARARLKRMRIGAGRNQRRQFNVIAADIVHDIRQNAVGCDHTELLFLRDRADIGQHKAPPPGKISG